MRVLDAALHDDDLVDQDAAAMSHLCGLVNCRALCSEVDRCVWHYKRVQ